MLGSLHYYDWFRTLAAHDVRHTKQLRKVIRDLAGDVAKVPKMV